MTTIDMGDWTTSQRRQLLVSYFGQRVQLLVDSDVRAGLTSVDCEPFAIALASTAISHESLLVVRDYADARHRVIELDKISVVVPREWALSDPRHPQYEKPEQVVTIRPKRDRRRGQRAGLVVVDETTGIEGALDSMVDAAMKRHPAGKQRFVRHEGDDA